MTKVYALIIAFFSPFSYSKSVTQQTGLRPTPVHVQYYADIVLNYWLARGL